MATHYTRCDEAERGVLVERFLARTLSSTERERFESHFVMCEHCQRALEMGTAIRVAFRDTTTVGRESVLNRLNDWKHWNSFVGIAAALLAMVLVVDSWPKRITELERLGAVGHAPVYLGIPVRADAETAGETAFAAAMRAYAAERYSDAASGLRRAIAAGADNPPTQFFLGASLLASGDARDAVAAFTSVIAAGDSPYRVEAYYYRAKASLQLRERESAIADLREASKSESQIGAQSRALRDSVMGVVVR